MTTALTSSADDKGCHGGIHGLHLLSTVVDTFIHQQVINRQSTFPNNVTKEKASNESPEALFSLAYSVPSDIPIENRHYGRRLADFSMFDGKLNQHDLLTKSARSFPAGICNSFQEKGRGAGKLNSHLPVRISHPAKGSGYRSTVFATRSKIGSHFVSPVTKAMKIARPDLVLPSLLNMATSSSPESSAMSQNLRDLVHDDKQIHHPHENLQMLPHFYQHQHRQLAPIAFPKAGAPPKQQRELVRERIDKEAVNASIKHQYNNINIRTHCNSILNGRDRKNDFRTGNGTVSTACASASINADKVPDTAFMANGERVMAKKCTAELNYIKHKAVPMREKWMARFLELAEFKKKYGHTKVPHNFPDSPKLAEWQKFQRQQRKLFVKGKHSQLTPERVIMLEKIGFVWEARIDAWESHHENLRRFKEANGHIYVPVANTVLSQWVKRQRKQYKKYEKGQDSSLTSDRVDRLNRLGFIWDGRHLTE